MSSRIGPGPVFVYESLILARRRRVYAGRVVFVLALLISLWISWRNNLNGPALGWGAASPRATLLALARCGESFFYAVAGIQLAMVLLVAPAATAGTLCQDRAKGILAQVATTDLSDAEIVLGKVFSRLAPILALLACALPVVSLAALLGGIDGGALAGLFVVSAVVAVLCCALALAVSVEVVRTDEVVMAVLALEVAWLLSLPLWGGMARTYGLPPPPDWVYAANPFVLVYAPYSWPGHFGLGTVAIFAAAALAVTAGLVWSTTARLRRFVLPAEVGGRRKLRVPVPGLATFRAGLARHRAWRERLPGPSLDGNPVLWREWHRSRPSRMARILWGVYWLGAVIATAIGVGDAIAYGIDTRTGGFMLHTALVLQSIFALMLISVQAPTALGEERIRGSLDALMAAPISTREIVWGKWMGAFRVALAVAVLPGVCAALIAAITPDVPSRLWAGAGRPLIVPIGPADRVLAPLLVVAALLSWGAAFTSLGLLLATWTPRIDRALGISVGVFLVLSVGWPFLCGAVVLPALQAWAFARYNVNSIDLHWVEAGLLALSPMAAPIVSMQMLDAPYAGRWQFWAIMALWSLLACALAKAMYVAVLRSFDRQLGRMPEAMPCRAVPFNPGAGGCGRGLRRGRLAPARR